MFGGGFSAGEGVERRVRLTGWRGVNRVELAPVLEQEVERVTLVELERVPRLRADVDPPTSNPARW